MTHYLYTIINEIDGTIYVGKSVNPKRRWKSHRSASRKGDQRHLYCAMRKYGIDNFKFEVVDQRQSEDECFELEKLTIESFLAQGKRLYNLDSGGGGYRSEYSNESLGKKISQKLIEYWQNPERRQALSLSTKEGLSRIPHDWGKKGIDHHKAKLSESDVKEIRRLREESSMTLQEIGELFGVRRQTIYKIVKKVLWTHID